MLNKYVIPLKKCSSSAVTGKDIHNLVFFIRVWLKVSGNQLLCW